MQFKFSTRCRRQGESIAKFVAELLQIAHHCGYEAILEDMLRDRLVCGVNDSRVQRRLLSESDLTFTGRAAPILVSVLISGRYCCFHEVSESAIILFQIPILIREEDVLNLHKSKGTQSYSRERRRAQFTQEQRDTIIQQRKQDWYVCCI